MWRQRAWRLPRAPGNRHGARLAFCARHGASSTAFGGASVPPAWRAEGGARSANPGPPRLQTFDVLAVLFVFPVVLSPLPASKQSKTHSLHTSLEGICRMWGPSSNVVMALSLDKPQAAKRQGSRKLRQSCPPHVPESCDKLPECFRTMPINFGQFLANSWPKSSNSAEFVQKFRSQSDCSTNLCRTSAPRVTVQHLWGHVCAHAAGAGIAKSHYRECVAGNRAAT